MAGRYLINVQQEWQGRHRDGACLMRDDPKPTLTGLNDLLMKVSMVFQACRHH